MELVLAEQDYDDETWISLIEHTEYKQFSCSTWERTG